MSRPLLRRRILINEFQYRLLAVNLLYYCAVILVFVVVLFLPPILQLRSATLSEDNEQVAVAFLFLHSRLWPALLLVLGLAAFHSVIISHRIAGPLYRFRCVWKAVAEGDLSVRAKLRKNDYLKSDADVMNAMIETLGTRIRGIDAQSTALRGVFDDLRRAREGGSAGALDTNLQRLGALLDGLETRVSQFRVERTDGDGSAPATVSASALIDT